MDDLSSHTIRAYRLHECMGVAALARGEAGDPDATVQQALAELEGDA